MGSTQQVAKLDVRCRQECRAHGPIWISVFCKTCCIPSCCFLEGFEGFCSFLFCLGPTEQRT